MVDLPRAQASLERIAADVDELARARQVTELDVAAVRPDRRAERRRRAAEDDLDFRQFGARDTANSRSAATEARSLGVMATVPTPGPASRRRGYRIPT
jgi:hypothetical protein